MTATRNLYDLATPLVDEELDAALFDMTGDLDKARVLHETLPRWMVEAPPTALAAVEQAYLDSVLSRQRLEYRVSRLQSLDEFCTQKLHNHLTSHGHLHLKVREDYLEQIKRVPFEITPNVSGITVYSDKLEQHSLVQAAMQNFSAAEAQVDGLPEKSLIRQGADHCVAPGITAHQFVVYCRELDLGHAYQEHIREVFDLPAPGQAPMSLSYNQAALDVGRGKCADMLIDLNIALARQDISAATHARLLKLVKADLPADQQPESAFTQKRLVWQGLNLDEVCLWSVLVFSEEDPGQLATENLIVYMPNEPLRPWYEYPKLEDFKQYLTLRLQVSSYRRAFTRYLDESERVDFLKGFDARRTLGALQAVPAPGNFSDFFFRAYIGKLQLDARLLAVPNADVDEEARQKRLQDYLDLGMDLLNVAAFVVPVLGQLMMGVAIGQLLGEVFDGVQDWSHGDHAEALKHVINVAENIAAMVLFAAGGRVVGSLKRQLGSSAPFFDRVEAVKLPDGRSRLWRPRLIAYSHSAEFAEPWVNNSRGVHQANGGAYIKVGDEYYGIVFDPDIGQWRASHPRRPQAYRPPLRHNYQGGWRHDFERPLEWTDPLYTLRRIDPKLADVPSEALQSIAAINQMDQPVLRRMMQENKAMPERFQDMVARFRQHQKVLDLIQALETGAPSDPVIARSQMLALPMMPGWPEGRFFELLDPQGDLLESHPDVAPFDYEDRSIHITEQQLKDGQVLDTLLLALGKQERATLLGEVVGLKDARPVLERRLLETVKDQHRALYLKLYDEYTGTPAGELAPLCARFPTIPRRLAWELLSSARANDRVHLRKTGQVTLSLEQRSREVLDQLGEDRALMGLYFAPLAGAATRRLTFGLLRRLAGWPRDLLLQLRDASVTGTVLEQVGPPTASVRRTIVRTQQGFQAFDEQGGDLDIMADGPDALLQTVVDCLSPNERRAMGLLGSQPVDRLRSQLRFKSQDERSRIRRYLRHEHAELEEDLLPCAKALVQSATGLADLPPGLVRKLKKLFPAMDALQLSQWLQSAGADHLSRAKAVEAQEQLFKALQQALKRWVSDRSGYVRQATAYWEYRLGRSQLRHALENSWRRLTTLKDPQQRDVPGLELDGMEVGDLPTLPPQVRFDHVEQLSLRNMGLNDDVAYFLKHFNGLHSLDLSDNRITRLPEALSLMPKLEYLYLPRNQLQLTEYTRKKLGDMRQLKTLDLVKNPLLNPPDVSRQFDLHDLLLRDCGLKEFPVGVERLPYLEHVDLRGNQITALPEWLLQLPRGAAQAFNLRFNPLSVQSTAALNIYLDRVGVGMGIREDNIFRLNEQKARESWLSDQRVADYVEKDRVWAQLRNESASEELFKLLAELVNTADAQNVREDLERRVWRVLNAAAADVVLREEVFDRAGSPINCNDTAAVNFSDLEVLVEIAQVSQENRGQSWSARPRLKVAKGLFRLDQLRGIASRHSQQSPAYDPLEVDLAYRTGLAGQVYLPGQPRTMLYKMLAGVSQANLDQAELELKSAELSPDLLKYVAKLPFWELYLKRTFASRFETLNAPFDLRADEVFEQREELPDADYQNLMEQIRVERDQAEALEIERLTDDALRNDDQHVCEGPGR